MGKIVYVYSMEELQEKYGQDLYMPHVDCLQLRSDEDEKYLRKNEFHILGTFFEYDRFDKYYQKSLEEPIISYGWFEVPAWAAVEISGTIFEEL